jgi:general secretion pathway protein D
MLKRWAIAALAAALAVGLSACGKGSSDYKSGRNAEFLNDYDTALVHYERALRADPRNVEYKLKATRLRFETGQFHVQQGQKHREKGQMQLAVAEFEKATAIDPASPIAQQELRATLELIANRQASMRSEQPAPEAAPAVEETRLVEKPAVLMPISREFINLKITNEARIVYETIAKLAGLTVVFDPDFQSRRIATELTNVTLEQALDIVALQSKSFWKPVTASIIFIAPEQAQKRRDFEEMVVRTFYLSNTLQPQDLTEIVTGLRQLLDIKRIQQVNSQNALVIRDTLDKILIAEKIIRDIDKAKPEVVIQVSVLQARRDRARDLGITPGSSAVLTFTPRNATGGAGGGASQLRLKELQGLGSGDYSLTLPGAQATALITDSTTRIIQNPEIRVVDGQAAKLRVGDRVPIATGSFGAGLGVGGVAGQVGGAAGLVNPLVNTQFQYIDVGVNIDITPRIHPNREISMKVAIEVSSVTGRVSIGGIEQPVISQRKIEHDIRLREGEVNVLGGIVEESESKSISGWPGLSKIPFLRYFFSGESVDKSESEVLIVLTPRIVRLPEITPGNLKSILAGTDTNVSVRQEFTAPPKPEAPKPAPQETPAQPPVTQPRPPATQPPAAQAPTTQPAPPATPPAAETTPAKLRFEPATLTLKTGETTTLAVVVDDVKDLFSIPMLLQYNPAVISVEEVRHGGFLSGGTQEIAIVQRVDKERGQAIISATRQPNTPGVSGTGTLVGIVIKALAPGSSSISVVQVRARDSQQKPITLVSSEAAIRVQ